MLLRELLQLPKISSNVLFWSPFEEQTREQLVQEVIGLANADVDGPRYIFFGVNVGTMEGKGSVGIDETAIANLKKAHRLISGLVKPVLELAFIFDKIEGKLVGALEIDGCDNMPYVVRQDFSDKLSGGQSWIREGSGLRAVGPHDAEQIRARAPRKHALPVKIRFNDQPDCELLELKIPDTSNPPSAQASAKVKKALDWKAKAQDAIGTINTHISRLLHVREHGSEAEFDQRGVDTLVDLHGKIEADNEFADADDYYFFEEKALLLNLAICNTGENQIRDARIELVFPRTSDFDVVDRLYTSPEDKRSRHEIEMADYPEVRQLDDTTVVRTSLGNLAANCPQQLFGSALRLTVKPKMRGKKVSIRYMFRAKNKQSTATGCLKIKFY